MVYLYNEIWNNEIQISSISTIIKIMKDQILTDERFSIFIALYSYNESLTYDFCDFTNVSAPFPSA